MATAEEKIDKYLDSLTRDEKEERMRECIENYDICTLIEIAQTNMMSNVEDLSDKDFNDEYYEWFSCELDEMFEDDEVTVPNGIIIPTDSYKVTHGPPTSCVCDMNAIMREGCQCGGS